MLYHAPQNCWQVPHPQDHVVCEVIDLDTIVYVMLSYTETEEDGPGSESLRRTQTFQPSFWGGFLLSNSCSVIIIRCIA